MKRRLSILFPLLVLGVALIEGSWLLFRLFYASALVVGFCYLWAWANNIKAVRLLTQPKATRLLVGQSLIEEFTVHNAARLPKVGLGVRVDSDLPGHQAGMVMNLPAGKSHSWKAQTECRRRGLFRIGPPILISSDPFGLIQQERTEGQAHTLLICPATVELPRLTLSPIELPGESPLPRGIHHFTPEASGVRDYVPGDSFSRIHWRSTARTGSLMVKIFDSNPLEDVWIILDMEERIQAGAEEESTEEYGVTIAASVAKRCLEANCTVGLTCHGEHHYGVRPGRGEEQLWRILEALALVKAQGKASLAEVIATEGRRFGRGTAVVIITPSAEESWANSLWYLTRQGAGPTVMLLEPSSFGGRETSLPLANSLSSRGILTYLVKKGEPIGQALSTSTGEIVTPRRR